MSLTIKTAKGVTTLTWESPAMGAFWKIRPDLTDEEIIEVLTNMVITMKGSQMDREARIFELETELGIAQNPAAAPPATSAGLTPPVRTITSSAARTTVPPPPAKPGTIMMMPPASLSDMPADGGPATQGVDFSALPSTEVPGHLSKDWQMAPPEEMERW